MNAITLNLSPVIKLTDEQFFKLAASHKHLQIERNSKGELIIMPPTEGKTGKRNFSLLGQLWAWVEKNSELGVGFDSSTQFNLPNGGDRSPDAAWIKLQRWNALTAEEQDGFPPICPDFAIELRSRTDSIKQLQDKMQEYIASGLRLGWLIDPQSKKVGIYRQGRDVEVLQSPVSLSGEDVLPGFVLNLELIWK